MKPTQAKQILTSLAAAALLSISTGAAAEVTMDSITERTLNSIAEQSAFVAEQELILSTGFWETASSRMLNPVIPGTVVAVRPQQLRSNRPERRRNPITPV